MINVMALLGTGLVRKDKRSLKATSTTKDKLAKVKRRKMSVELFLRDILGTHLIEKKF